MERYQYILALFSLSLFNFPLPAHATSTANDIFCENYVKLSIAQYKSSITSGCNFSGLHWNNDIESQKKWCLSVDELTASKETLARAEALIECRLTPIKPVGKAFSYEEKEAFTQALIDAAVKDDLVEIKKLIIQGADINRELSDNLGTPLLAAIQAQSENAVRLFIEQGVDPQRTSNGGENPLNYLLRGNENNIINYTLLEYLLNNGINSNKLGESGDIPLFIAIENNDIRAIKLLLQQGSNPNLQLNQPDTPLATAIKIALEKNNNDIVKLLLEFGANPNISTGKQNCTGVNDSSNYASFPFALAAKNSSLKKLLQQFGAKDEQNCIAQK